MWSAEDGAGFRKDALGVGPLEAKRRLSSTSVGQVRAGEDPSEGRSGGMDVPELGAFISP